MAFSPYVPAVRAVCNPVTGLGCQRYYAAYLTVYSNPTNGGTISGYPSGTTFTHNWCSLGTNVAFSIYETPNSGFGFQDWSNGQTATSITVEVPCGSSGSITAGFFPLIVTDADAYTSANGSPEPLSKSFNETTFGRSFSLSGFTNSTYPDQDEGSNFTVSIGTVKGTDFVFIFYFQEGWELSRGMHGRWKILRREFYRQRLGHSRSVQECLVYAELLQRSISASYMPLSGSTQLNDLGRFAMLYSPTFYNWLGGFSSNLKSLGAGYVADGDNQNPNNMTEITLGEYYWDVGAAMWSFQQDMGGASAYQQNQIISSYVIVRSTAVFDSLQFHETCEDAIIQAVALGVILGIATGGVYAAVGAAVDATAISTATATSIVIGYNTIQSSVDIFDGIDIYLYCVLGK